MKSEDLKKIIDEIIKEQGQVSPELLRVFEKLTDLTISFRDRWKAEHCEILTVEETRNALTVYMTALRIERMPDNLSEKTAGLVKLWLKEINGITY